MKKSKALIYRTPFEARRSFAFACRSPFLVCIIPCRSWIQDGDTQSSRTRDHIHGGGDGIASRNRMEDRIPSPIRFILQIEGDGVHITGERCRSESSDKGYACCISCRTDHGPMQRPWLCWPCTCMYMYVTISRRGSAARQTSTVSTLHGTRCPAGVARMTGGYCGFDEGHPQGHRPVGSFCEPMLCDNP